ncbi:MAG: lipopolysaccharide kinase InaA family protein [Rikenellaceae bacterium]
MSQPKIVINPKFASLTEFVENLPREFEKGGHTIYKIRNEIKYFDVDGVLVNVKRFCVPRIFFNRLAYKLIRKSKAQRAYEYALKLLSLDIDTPAPIAYIIEGGPFLLGYSYFVSIQVPHTHSVEELRDTPIIDERVESLLRHIGRYTATLHTKGICHNDYGHGNILYQMVDGAPQFCLVDINRMYFGEVSFERGCNNFSKMEGTPETFDIIARSYAEARGFDPEKTSRKIIDCVQSFRERRKRRSRKLLKTIFGALVGIKRS